MIKIRVFRGRTHHATFVRKEGIRNVYKLFCSGQEVLVSFRWYLNPGVNVSCKKCIKKREKIIENAVAAGFLSEPIAEGQL